MMWPFALKNPESPQPAANKLTNRPTANLRCDVISVALCAFVPFCERQTAQPQTARAPLRNARGRFGVESMRRVLIVSKAENHPVVLGLQDAPGVLVDAVLDEVNAAVAKRSVHASGV